MTRTMRIRARIPADRKLELTFPEEIPVGDADVVVSVTPRNEVAGSTAKELLESDVFGMWAGRTDIEDSATFAREQRDRAWNRARD